MIDYECTPRLSCPFRIDRSGLREDQAIRSKLYLCVVQAGHSPSDQHADIAARADNQPIRSVTSAVGVSGRDSDEGAASLGTEPKITKLYSLRNVLVNVLHQVGSYS